MIKFLFRSVRGRLLLLVAAIALPALVLAVGIIAQSYRNEKVAASAQLMSTARAIAGVVEGLVDKSDAQLTLLGASSRLRDGDLKGFDERARRSFTGKDRWFVLSDLSGTQLVNTRLPVGAALLGRIDASWTRTLPPETAHYVSDLEFSADRSTSVVHFEQRWPSEGPTRYLLTLGVRPAALAQSLKVNQYAPGSIVVVADRVGTIIARSLNPEQYVGKRVTSHFYEAMKGRSEGVVESESLEHIPVLTAFYRTTFGWTVAIALPRDRLYSSSQRLLGWAIGLSALLTALAILLASWISRALVRSVDLLSEDAEALGRGEMPKLQSSGLAETDFVAGAMHRTADLLRQRTLDNAALNAELERKVEERTASLREAMNQMEEFSYTVSHDLRSPLRAMQGYAQILLEENRVQLNESGKNYLDRISRAAERMDRLTADLLGYSRLSRAQIQLAKVDLDALVRSAIEHYIELHRLGADVRVESPLLPVLAHEPSLTQALSNLFTNALKFVKPGQNPVVTLRTERVGDRVRIWIEDQGIGIAPEHQAGLFRMFERLPTTGKYEGTGIGLAIVRKAAEKMGGSCGVVSDGKSGSSFWIELAAA